jgi:NAD binding domain of 6-phosphogluconate dehydrogenase
MRDVVDVGFIGMGQMGAAMARNLVKAGHRVTVYNRTHAKAEALAAEGARVAERIAEACRSEILITMLADDAAVEAVLFSDSGVGQSLAAGHCWPSGASRTCRSSIDPLTWRSAFKKRASAGSEPGCAALFRIFAVHMVALRLLRGSDARRACFVSFRHGFGFQQMHQRGTAVTADRCLQLLAKGRRGHCHYCR